MAHGGGLAVTQCRGYTIVEMITVTGLLLVIASLVASLHFTIARAVETELARSEMVAGAREVIHSLQSDVRRADSLALSASRLTMSVQGERITYATGKHGVNRESGAGTRALGCDGISVAFSLLGGHGVEVVLDGERTVRSRMIAVHREVVIARRTS
jgi:hypothetical protein